MSPAFLPKVGPSPSKTGSAYYTQDAQKRQREALKMRQARKRKIFLKPGKEEIKESSSSPLPPWPPSPSPFAPLGDFIEHQLHAQHYRGRHASDMKQFLLWWNFRPRGREAIKTFQRIPESDKYYKTECCGREEWVGVRERKLR